MRHLGTTLMGLWFCLYAFSAAAQERWGHFYPNPAYPGLNEKYLLSYRAIFNESDYVRGLKLVDETIRELPPDDGNLPALLLLKGRAEYATLEYEKAMATLEQGLDLVRDNPEKMDLQADFYLVQGLIACFGEHDAMRMEAYFEHVQEKMRSGIFFKMALIDITRNDIYFELDEELARATLVSALRYAEQAYWAASLKPFPNRWDEMMLNRCLLLLSKLHVDIGYLYEYEQDIPRAAAFYEKSLEFLDRCPLPDIEKRINSNFNLAYAKFYLRDYEQAEALSKSVLEQNRAMDIPDWGYESGCLTLLGDIRFHRRDWDDSEKYFQRALDSAKKDKQARRSDFQYYYERLAGIYLEKEEYGRALEYYAAALARSPNPKNGNALAYQLGMGNALFHLDKSKAQSTYRKALALALEMDSRVGKGMLPEIYYQLGLLEKSIPEKMEYLLASRRAFLRDSIPSRAAALNLSELARYAADEEDALRYTKEAIRANINLEAEYDTTGIPDYEDILHPIQLLECYDQLANIHILRKPRQAMAEWRKAMDLITIIKPFYQYEGSQSALTLVSIPVYEGMVAAAAKGYLETGGDEYFDEAFEALIRSKAIRLTDALNDYEAVQRAGIPDSVYQRGQAIKGRLSDLRRAADLEGGELGAAEKRRIRDEIVENNIRYERFQQELKEDYPDYYVLKYDAPAVSSSDLQRHLEAGQVLVEYHVGASSLYTFIIDAKGKRISIHPIPQEHLEEQVNELLAEVRKGDEGDVSELSRSLYDILLREALAFSDNYTQITIVPDGALYYLPFAILSHNGNMDECVLMEYDVSYLHSATQLVREADGGGKSGLLGIIPEYDGRTGLKPLPYAVQELEEIHRVYPGELLSGAAATAGNFLRRVDGYSLLHIAGHTEVDMNKPLLSRLVFSPGARREKGYLYAYELYDMKLDLDMVSLSSCNSGVGRIERGEGVMSLARGFAHAGCPTTVTTLWPMTDRPTKEIMVGYYHYLETGMRKSAALRRSQLDYLAQSGPKGRSPYLWAGIVVIGSDAPLTVTDRGAAQAWYIASGMAVLAGMGWWVWKRQG